MRALLWHLLVTELPLNPPAPADLQIRLFVSESIFKTRGIIYFYNIFFLLKVYYNIQEDGEHPKPFTLGQFNLTCRARLALLAAY